MPLSQMQSVSISENKSMQTTYSAAIKNNKKTIPRNINNSAIKVKSKANLHHDSGHSNTRRQNYSDLISNQSRVSQKMDRSPIRM